MNLTDIYIILLDVLIKGLRSYIGIKNIYDLWVGVGCQANYDYLSKPSEAILGSFWAFFGHILAISLTMITFKLLSQLYLFLVESTRIEEEQTSSLPEISSIEIPSNTSSLAQSPREPQGPSRRKPSTRECPICSKVLSSYYIDHHIKRRHNK